MKKIIAFILIVLTLLFAFSSCGEQGKNPTIGSDFTEKATQNTDSTEQDTQDAVSIIEQIGKEASEGAVSLSMYLMSEVPVSENQEALIEEAVNEITESRYKIHMDLTFVVADDYYDVLDERLNNMEVFYNNVENGKETMVTENPVYIDEYGLPQVYYPLIQPYDVDIFYFAGIDKHNEYIEKGYLANITEEVKVLKATTNSDILAAYKELNKNEFYAVPINTLKTLFRDIETPITNEDIYGQMFGVSKLTDSVASSMKIITLLGDNEFRNLLLMA